MKIQDDVLAGLIEINSRVLMSAVVMETYCFILKKIKE